jgi:hypothetical protein
LAVREMFGTRGNVVVKYLMLAMFLRYASQVHGSDTAAELLIEAFAGRQDLKLLSPSPRM